MQPLLTEELEALKANVGQLGQDVLAPLAARHGEAPGYPVGLSEALYKSGILAHMFPIEYGGNSDLGFRALTMAVIREELSRTCPEADIMFAMQGLGSHPIFAHGSREMQDRWLPPVARGEALAAFALTEPEAGSDAANIQTCAVLHGDVWVLNGTKTFISNAGVASVYTVFAKTSEERSRGISAFVVPADAPGLRTEPLQLMVPHVIGDVHFDECQIPKENLIGHVGDGLKIGLGTLDVFRTTVGAQSVGLAQAALDHAVARAKHRSQFGQSISQFQMIQSTLAEMAMQIKAARLLVYHAAWLWDHVGHVATMDSSMAKAFATEMAIHVVNHAVQIFGGYGLRKDYPLERLYREVRAPAIYEGTSEIQRLIIARHLLGTRHH